MKIAFNPSTVAALTSPPNNKDITFDLKGHNIFARGVEFKGTDTNTWRPVVDNLISDSTTNSLSAKQGKVLKALIDGKSNSGHTHDDRYLKLTGGVLTGNLTGTSATFSGRFHGGGDDEGIIIKPASNGYAGLTLGAHDGERSVFYFTKGNPFWRYNNGSANLDIKHPKKAGTIALTSDIPTKSSWNYDDRYLRLSGGTMNSDALITFADSGSWGTDKGPLGARGGLRWTGQSDSIKLYAEETAVDNLDLVIQFGDDNSNGLSVRNKTNTQTSYISASGVITTGTFKGNLDWSYITNKPSSYTPSAHTHAWNSLTHSSTTANQAILTNGSANGWKLYTLNIAAWDNAASKAHSHSNKAVIDGITSTHVSNWNTAYNFVNNITKADTDKVINKWDEIVNFLAGIDSNNKLNTLLNSKLSIQQLAANDILTTKTNNALFWVNTVGTAGNIPTGPFTDHPYALLSVTNYSQNDTNGKFFYRSRLAFNSVGDIKVASCHHQGEYKQDETWYNVLTSKNSGISGSTIKLNGTSITVYSSGTADNRYVKKSGDTMTGALNFANGTWNKVGDDIYMGDHNIGGQLCLMGITGNTGISFHKQGDASIRKSITFNGSTLYMNGNCDYASLANQSNLLAMNTVPNKTTSTSVGSWSPISGRYVFHQRWTDTSTGSDGADFGIYLDGNLTANMVLDGYYNSLSGFRVIGAKGGFLKANGTIDNSTYLTSHQSLSNYYTKGEINTKLSGYLPLSGGTMTGQISSNYSVGTWIGGCTNAILKATADGYNSLICAPIKSGNISISAWTAENNLNFGYAKKGKTENSFDTRMYWDAPNNNLHAAAFTGHLYGTADNAINSDTVDGEHASNFSYTHQTSFDFNTSKSGRIVTFDQSGTDYSWINGFASTHGNYLTSVIFNSHRTSNWYVGYIEANTSTGKTQGLQAVHKLAFVDQIPTALKNPYVLTISLNGTSQGPYDGSAAKSINITPGSIGAATSGHNHDGRYVYNYGGTQMDGASRNKNALGMSTTSGISGDWWHILQAAWNDEYRWNSQIAFPTQNRNGMYYRSGLDDNTKWGAWVKLLDTGNSSISGNTITINGSSLTVSKSDHNHNGKYLRLDGSDTMQGNLNLCSVGTSYIGKGSGDKSGADFTEANIVIRSWWGISFKSFDDKVRTYIDTRTGNIGTKGKFIGDLTGNSDTTTKWKTARAFTIGNTSKNVDGSNNVSWSLSEIGAASSGHNHDNKYLKWLGNAGQSNMNAIGRISHSSGMTALADPGNTTDNPMEGGSKSTSWHLYWQTNYTDDPSGSNAWVAQIVNRAGTDRWWVRSRSGGTITNGTGWASNWRFLVTAPTSGLGNGNQPIYINSAGEVVAANSYPTSLRSPHALTLKANGTTLATYDGSSAKEANFTYANVGAASANHTHTVFRNNLMIKGTDGISGSASIHLGIGDSDTGFKWISDGKCQIYANNVAIGEWTSGGMNWFRNPTVNGNKVWNAGNDGSGSGLDADLLDGWHKDNIQWTGYITSGNSLASYWFKMYDITVTSYWYNDITITFLVSEGYSAHFSIFYLKIRQNGTNNSGNYNLGVTLCELVGNLRDKVVAYYNNSTGNVQLWGNTGNQWNTMNYTVIKKTTRTATDSASLGTLIAQSFSSVQTPPSTGYTKVTMSRVGSVSYSDSTGSVHWNNITNKPSTFTPSSHTHTWASITDKLVATNEFNIVNAGFKESMWFNYLPINDRNKTAAVASYIMGNGAKGYASVQASGFIKHGSNSSYVLLGDGGHAAISQLSVKYATSAGSATKLVTARKIWGQSFNGTADVNGTIYINNGDSENGAIILNNDVNSNARISAIQDNVVFNTGGAIRFGDLDWDYSKWAGLKYNYLTKTIYLGIADGSIFTTYKDAQNGGTLNLRANISYIDLNSGTSIRGLSTNGSPYHSTITLKDTSMSLSTYGDMTMSTGPGTMQLSAANAFRVNANDIKFTCKGGFIECSQTGSNEYTWIFNNNIKTTGQIIREGSSQSWVNGRKGALLRETSVNGYHTLWSLKTTDGSWDFGEFNNNIPVLTYITDTNFNSGNNTPTYQIKFPLASGTVALTSNILNPTDYYWANIKVSASSNTQTKPSVNTIYANNWFRSQGATGWYNESYGGGLHMTDTTWIRTFGNKSFYCNKQIYSSDSIRMGDIYLEHTNEINSASGLHLNYGSSGNVSLCQGGGNVGIGTMSPTYKLDVNGQVGASGFHHASHNNNDAVLLAGGGYKTLDNIYEGDSTRPVFLGYLKLQKGAEGTVSSTFKCLGRSVPFTYTRGGNECEIEISNPVKQLIAIRAAVASVSYIAPWVEGDSVRGAAWWLHCECNTDFSIGIRGFHLGTTNNSVQGKNPLYSGDDAAFEITVCLFGFVWFD